MLSETKSDTLYISNEALVALCVWKAVLCSVAEIQETFDVVVSDGQAAEGEALQLFHQTLFPLASRHHENKI